MNRRHLKGWLKHGDFIVLDIIVLQICFVLSYWTRYGFQNPYRMENYQTQGIMLFLCQIFVILFFNNYEGIIRRRKFDEAVAVCKYVVSILLILLVYMFGIRQSADMSRIMVGLVVGYFVVLDYTFRQLNKVRIFHSKRYNKASIALITSKDLIPAAMAKLTSTEIYKNYFISSILILDGKNADGLEDYKIPIYQLCDESLVEICHKWTDEVFIIQPDNMVVSRDLVCKLVEMGLRVNYTMSALVDDRWPITDLRKLGNYKVLSTGINFATAGQLTIKRLIDIVGSIIGLVFTGLLTLFIGPIVYLKDPGSIFFSQERIGKNGKRFKMYKFRSMYKDAEERKKALMEQNKVKDGMMFKMDDDPRIIGSEKKDKNGKPKGIGNFIRKTSIDEFPQFLNVLKGQMSLVGTRPPTVDEWEKYDLEHRIRMATKPGVTGMWQVSGRSEITDFDEVVRLDREYIENWSLTLDVKIMIKTFLVVLKHKGAE